MYKFYRKLRYHAFQVLSPLKFMFEWLSEAECKISSFWVKSAHRRLMTIQWRMKPLPENFDHKIDLFYFWENTRNAQWLERGIYNTLALKGGNLLELCCGDGFNTRNFYSLISKQVIACDFASTAINVAKRKNLSSNISFLLADIRTEMPNGIFENIVWDAAIEHFTEEEIQKIMLDIKQRLTSDGILSGHTIVENSSGEKQLCHHEYEFKNKKDLLRFLSPHFKNVTVFETKYPGRHSLYFWASDSVIPFSVDWSGGITK